MRNVSKGRAEAHMSRSRGCPRGGGRFRRRRTTKPYASRVGSGRSGLSVARVERRSRSIPTPALRASRGVAPRARRVGGNGANGPPLRVRPSNQKSNNERPFLGSPSSVSTERFEPRILGLKRSVERFTAGKGVSTTRASLRVPFFIRAPPPAGASTAGTEVARRRRSNSRAVERLTRRVHPRRARTRLCREGARPSERSRGADKVARPSAGKRVSGRGRCGNHGVLRDALRVDGPDMCTLCLEPLPLPGPGADVVLKLHACGHCFHRDCAQEMLLNSLRKYEKPRCPNCRATLFTAPFGKLLGQRRQPRAKRMRNMRELISVSEVRLTPASAPAPPAPSPSINDTPISTTPDVAHHESFHGSTFLQLNPPSAHPSTRRST